MLTFDSLARSSAARSSFALLIAFGAALGGCGQADDDDTAPASGGAGTGGSVDNVGGTGNGGASTGGSATGGSATGGTSASGGAGATGGTAGGSGTGTGGTGPAGQGGTAQGGAAVGGSGANGGSGGSNMGGAGSGSAGTGAGGSAGMAGSGGGSTTPAVHFVGRVDDSDPNNARFAWSGTGVVAHFNGTQVSAKLGGSQQYTVVIDGTVTKPKLVATNGTNALATGLTAGEHTVELYRRTEANLGVATFSGFDFGGGTLLAPPLPTRRIEVVGDSITCGYGDEGADMNCSFSADTENHYLAYATLTARALNAELSTVAWSGKGVVCNYGDDATSCQDPLPTYYDRTLPDDTASKWDFKRFVADAVVVNLGTNDFSTTSDPTKMEFEDAYAALLQRIRAAYPNAQILCTNGPMLSGTDLSTLMGYIADVIDVLADPKISSFDIAPQDGSDGYGCDWHPSLARHQKMAATVTAAIKAKLPW
jgi:lysophospholipase L1-like esterase